MSEELTCEFRIKPGTKWEQPCGDPAGTYEVRSMVPIKLNLCNKHRDYLIAVYDWTVEKVEDACTTTQTNQSSK